MGVPRHRLAQMVGNVALEVVGGSVPVLGDLFDMALKANLRNIRLLEEHLRATGGEASKQSFFEKKDQKTFAPPPA